MNEAQPIETAPRDRRILVFRPHFGWVGGKWNDDRFARRPRPFWDLDASYITITSMRESPPTHWTELPPEP
jgi:hypothetical protein